jgi:hypothetical protein
MVIPRTHKGITDRVFIQINFEIPTDLCNNESLKLCPVFLDNLPVDKLQSLVRVCCDQRLILTAGVDSSLQDLV